MGITLKNFKLYLSRLETYAQANGITVKFVEHKNAEDTWTPRSRSITIDLNQDESSLISALLHELGHALDDMALESHKRKRLAEIYYGFYEDKYTPKQAKEIVECEIRAWNLGRSVARALKIPLGKWYDREQDYYVKDYKSHIRNKK